MNTDEREQRPRRIPPRPSTNHCGNCNKDYEFPAQESSCPHRPRAEITYCSNCGNFTEYACSDCRISDGSIVYVCHKDVCQREHEAVRRHVSNELFTRLDQVANDVCIFLLSHKNADAKAVIVRELKSNCQSRRHSDA